MKTDYQQIKNDQVESRIFIARVWVTIGIILLLLLVLLYRYYNLQIVDHQIYATQSDNNRVLVQNISPQRGLIFDSEGKLLADNRPSYILSLVPENIADVTETISHLRELIPITDKNVDDFYRFYKGNRRPFQPIPLRHRLTEEEIARIAVNKHQFSGVEVEADLVRHYPFGSLFAHSVGYVGKINQKELNKFDEEKTAVSYTHLTLPTIA